MSKRREFALGTYLEQSFPYGLFVSGRALASDGRVRNLKRIAETADTWFSVPAAMTVKGKTVSGYVTLETIEGYETETEGDPTVLKFRAYQYGKNSDTLPEGAYRVPYLETEEGAVKFLTRCSDSEGRHWSSGVTWSPEECPTCNGSNDASWLKTPASRYGRNSRACAPIAFAVSVIIAGETGEPMTEELLDSVMSQVVNDMDSPEELLRDYGREYGFSARALLER